MRDGFRVFRHPEHISPGKKLPWNKKDSVARGNLHSTFNAGKRTYLKVHLAKVSIQRTETPMQELYNCKSIDATHYRITKFDKHLDPYHNPKGKPSSYIVSKDGCDCPAGNAPKCRHRKILPAFIEHGYVDTEYFFVWDTQEWYKPTGIFAQAREANKRPLPAGEYDVVAELTVFPQCPKPFVINEGGTLPVSAAPSPQPSPKTYRRF